MQHLIEQLRKFRDERGWDRFHSGLTLSHKLQIESAEVAELFEWGQEPDINKLHEEVGDVLIIVLYLCEMYGIDPVIAILNKIQKNKIKYPDDYKNPLWKES